MLRILADGVEGDEEEGWLISVRISFSFRMCSTCFNLTTSVFFMILRAERRRHRRGAILQGGARVGVQGLWHFLLRLGLEGGGARGQRCPCLAETRQRARQKKVLQKKKKGIEWVAARSVVLSLSEEVRFEESLSTWCLCSAARYSRHQATPAMCSLLTFGFSTAAAAVSPSAFGRFGEAALASEPVGGSSGMAATLRLGVQATLARL